MKPKPRASTSRKMTQMIHFKLYPEEKARIEAAMAVHPNRWRGVSFFARSALLMWAETILKPVAPVASQARARKRRARKAA